MIKKPTLKQKFMRDVNDLTQILLVTRIREAGVFLGRFSTGIHEPRMSVSRDVQCNRVANLYETANFLSYGQQLPTIELADVMTMREAYTKFNEAEKVFTNPRFQTPERLVYDRDHAADRIEHRKVWRALCSLACNTANYFQEEFAGTKKHRDLLGRIDRRSLDDTLLQFGARDVYITVKRCGYDSKKLAQALLGRYFAMFRNNNQLAEELLTQAKKEAKGLYSLRV